MHSSLKQRRQLLASKASRILACSNVLPVTSTTTHTQQPATRDASIPPAHTKQCRATGHDSRRSNGTTQDNGFAGHAQSAHKRAVDSDQLICKVVCVCVDTHCSALCVCDTHTGACSSASAVKGWAATKGCGPLEAPTTGRMCLHAHRHTHARTHKARTTKGSLLRHRITSHKQSSAFQQCWHGS